MSWEVRVMTMKNILQHSSCEFHSYSNILFCSSKQVSNDTGEKNLHLTDRVCVTLAS